MIGSSNISTTVVGNELGVSTHNIRELCTSNNINMWSKCKPLSWDKDVLDRNSEWWRGKDGLCGLDINSSHIYGSVNLFATAARNGQIQNWNYLKPTGGSSSPYRLADFMNYNHNAVPPFSKLINKNITVYPSTKVLTVQYNANTSDTTSVSIKDIRIPIVGMNTEDMYLGILVYDGSTYMCGTDTKKMSEYFVGGDDVIGISISNYNYTGTRTWNVIPFLCTVSFSDNALPSSGTIIPIPMAEGTISITMHVSSVTMYNYGYFLSSDMTKLYYGFTINNNTGSSVTTGEINVVLLNSNQDQILRVATVPSQTIPSGTSFQYNDKVLNNVSGDVAYNARYIRSYYGRYDAMVEKISTVSIEDTIP